MESTPSQGSLRRSLEIQLRVIWALLMREVITRFGRENIGVLWLVGEPMIFTLGITALWTGAGLQHGSSLPISAFAVTGYSSVLMWRNAVNRCNNGVQQNTGLLYHRNVKVLDVFITRIIIEMAGASGSFMVLASFFTYIGWIDLPVDLLAVLQGWFMLAWFGLSLALLIGAASAYSELVERLWHPTAYLLFPMSGAAFMVDWLPPEAQKIVLLLPMVHGVEMIREGYFGDVVRTHYDINYMATCNLVLLFVALVLVRDSGRRVEVR